MGKEKRSRPGIGALLFILMALCIGVASSVAADSVPPDSASMLPESWQETALQKVSQTTAVPKDRLSTVETLSLELPLTERVIYRVWVLDKEGRGALLHEVTLDEVGEPLPAGREETLWTEEEKAYRHLYENTILRLVAQEHDLSIDALRLANAVLRLYPHTGRSCLQTKILETESGRLYGLAIDAEGQPADVEALEEAEFEAQRAKYGRLDRELYYLLETKMRCPPFFRPRLGENR